MDDEHHPSRRSRGRSRGRSRARSRARSRSSRSRSRSAPKRRRRGSAVSAAFVRVNALSDKLVQKAALVGLRDRAELHTLGEAERGYLELDLGRAFVPEGEPVARGFKAPRRAHVGRKVQSEGMRAMIAEADGPAAIVEENTEWQGAAYNSKGRADGTFFLRNAGRVDPRNDTDEAANAALANAQRLQDLFTDVARRQHAAKDRLWRFGGRATKNRQSKAGAKNHDPSELVSERFWLEIGWTFGPGTSLCKVFGRGLPTLRRSQPHLDAPRGADEDINAYVRRITSRRLLVAIGYFLALHFYLTSPTRFAEQVALFSGNGSEAFSVFACLHDDDRSLWAGLPKFREIMLAFTSIAAIYGDSKTELLFHTDPNTTALRPGSGERVFSAQIAISGGVNMHGQILGYSPVPRKDFTNGTFSGTAVAGVPKKAVIALQKSSTITSGCMQCVHGGDACTAVDSSQRCTRLFGTIFSTHNVDSARRDAADGARNGYNAGELHVLEKCRSHYHREVRTKQFKTAENPKWPAAKAELDRREGKHDADRARRREDHVRSCGACRFVRALAKTGRSMSHVVHGGQEVTALEAAKAPKALKHMQQMFRDFK